MEPIEGDRDLIKEMLKTMPDNRGVSLQQAGDDMHVHTVTPEDLKKLGDDPSLFHVIFMFDRPGANYFANYLEFTYFPPDGPLNKELQYRAYRWHGMLWAIISIPVEKQDLCYETAEVTKMRLANGIPCMMGAAPLMALGATREDGKIEDSCEFFPLRSASAFTLENVKGDVMYEGKGGEQDAKHSEEYKLEKLWEDYEKKSE
jgi:hypothetical protein